MHAIAVLLCFRYKGLAYSSSLHRQKFRHRSQDHYGLPKYSWILASA